MGLMNKLKNILFEEDPDDNIPVIEKKEEARPKLKITEDKIENDDIRHQSFSEEEFVKEEPKETKSPFQTFDEEEFDRIAAINRNRLLERDRKAREAKELEQRKLEKTKLEPRRDSRLDDNKKRYQDAVSSINSVNKRVLSEDTHKFKPSPVISPVYGILDKNYRKEDILPRASSEGTLPKLMDVDKVREKAFGILESELEASDPLRKFNGEESKDEPIIDIDDNDVLTKTAEIKITDLENHLEESIMDTDFQEHKDVLIEQPITDKEEVPFQNNNKNEEESLESDLFNLIDSMYESRKEEE